jgi:hypothetical protein
MRVAIIGRLMPLTLQISEQRDDGIEMNEQNPFFK